MPVLPVSELLPILKIVPLVSVDRSAHELLEPPIVTYPRVHALPELHRRMPALPVDMLLPILKIPLEPISAKAIHLPELRAIPYPRVPALPFV